ncbi:MAG: cation-translocating P-type ATPase [Clostridia bacterium]|nr:cation-translocating P-type ATPase [Clostridia bacterium]
MEQEKEVIRYNPNCKSGLTKEQIEERVEHNLVNHDMTQKTKSIKAIICSNFLTIFNLINLLLAIAVFCVGSYKNMLFLGLVIINTAISTIQEIHSKRVIDKLSIIASTKVSTIRDGKKSQIGINEVCLDDIVIFEAGNQVVNDSIVQDGEVQVNESCITGESDTITKKKGDMLLSGSYIVSGKCCGKVEHIGEDNYTYKISSQTKYVKKINSEIMNSLNKIIKTVSIVIVPVGLLLFFNQIRLEDATLQKAVVNTVAAIIGMIPEGLVLLTSTVLAVSVIRLSRNKVLVQELYCIETLARVDTLCLDKTGTITEGSMEVKEIISKNDKKEMETILSMLAKYSQDNNGTIEAIRDRFHKKVQGKVKKEIPFSSDKKWSGISFEDGESYILGAPEYVLKNQFETYKDEIEKYIEDYRVVVLAKSNELLNKESLPKNLEFLGIVLLTDKIRPQAEKTLEYFKQQGVTIKLISGDNPITVSKIAKQVGLEGYQNYIDCSKLETEEQTKKIAEKFTVFGRVSPLQKKWIIQALKQQGHTVAMTGDGVNDVIALKEADCSIAIASGSDAARNVSQLVLLDSNFKSMPQIVAEGRRTINNIERSASLFLSKTIYATILAIIFVFAHMPYPFMPIQLSLISLVCIGIPSFILALEPNKELIKGKFIQNVISKALPTALTTVVNICIIAIMAWKYCIPIPIYSTLCVISTVMIGFILLSKISKPFNLLRSTLLICMIILFVACFMILKDWFSVVINLEYALLVIGICSIGSINFILFNEITKKILKKK